MIHLRHLTLTNVATHSHSEVALPTHGIVVLTGGNGAGKSTLLEAVATGLWGESLRGELPWLAGVAGAVTITTDGIKATRKRSKAGSSKLDWNEIGQDAIIYETTSKAQAGLEALIGSYDVWRRTCVLSSVDSAAFSLARDSDRKRLLEEFLGLGLFDTALEACRKDKKEAQAKAAKAEKERTEVNLQLRFAQDKLNTAKMELAALAPVEELESVREQGKDLAAKVEDIKQQLREADVRRMAATKQKAAIGAVMQAEKARLDRMKDDTCITCGQNVVDVRNHLKAEVHRLRSQTLVELSTVELELEALAQMIPLLEKDLQTYTNQLNNLRAEYKLMEYATRQRAGLAQKVLDCQNEVATWQAKADALSADNHDLEVAHLDAVEQVLGLRGVRAQVLEHSLGALEQQANAWLARMPTEHGPLSIALSGSTVQKSGSTVDSISLKVNERPYASCSGGERRRVDVALLLSLRELAVAAHGRDGSLLCDEVFDALDAQGQADVAAALAEMSADRMVLVVTHSPELAKALRPSMRLHVSLEDGRAKVATS